MSENKQPTDITELDAVKYSEEGIDVPIVHPRTQETIGLTIRVQGAFGSKFKELMARNKKREALRQKSAVARAVAADEDDTSEVLAEVTLGWTGMIEKGKEVPFSKGEALRVYESYPVIRGQVLAAVLDVANFTRG